MTPQEKVITALLNGRLTIGKIAEDVGMSYTGVSRQLDPLIIAGLVRMETRYARPTSKPVKHFVPTSGLQRPVVRIGKTGKHCDIHQAFFAVKCR